MNPPPYTLLSDAKFMANMAAKALQDSKIYPLMAGYYRGQALGFIIAAKQFVHANNMMHQFVNVKGVGK